MSGIESLPLGSKPWQSKTLKEWWAAHRADRARDTATKLEHERELAELRKQLGGGEVAALKEQLDQVRRELSAARYQSPRGAAGTSVAGHPALSSFRLETYDEARRKLLRLPGAYSREGALSASESATFNAAFDIELLAVAPPLTGRTVMGRDRVQKMMSDPARTAALMLDEPAGRLAFRAMMHGVEEHYFRPAVPHLLRRTAEDHKDSWGT